MPKWSLFFIYFAVYGTVRFLLELLRIDTTYRLLGISRNGWIGLGVAIAGYVLTFIWLRRTPAVRRDLPSATP